jgi:hypothetical protein
MKLPAHFVNYFEVACTGEFISVSSALALTGPTGAKEVIFIPSSYILMPLASAEQLVTFLQEQLRAAYLRHAMPPMRPT